MGILRATDPPIPPDELRFMGEDAEGFIAIGDRLVGDLKRVAGLAARSTVLDIGCGYGRVAHALLRDRSFRGRYRGLDILPRHVAWCRDHLGNWRFRFCHLDVRNDRYNPNGQLEPTEASLPAPGGSVDVVVAASVFTHMWPEEITHYLTEIAGVLRPTGQAYLTFFLLNESWEALHESGSHGSVVLGHRHNNHTRFMNEDDPLHAIGYDQDWVLEEAERTGLVCRHVQFGAWSGRADGQGFQDAMVFGLR